LQKHHLADAAAAFLAADAHIAPQVVVRPWQPLYCLQHRRDRQQRHRHDRLLAAASLVARKQKHLLYDLDTVLGGKFVPLFLCETHVSVLCTHNPC